MTTSLHSRWQVKMTFNYYRKKMGTCVICGAIGLCTCFRRLICSLYNCKTIKPKSEASLTSWRDFVQTYSAFVLQRTREMLQTLDSFLILDLMSRSLNKTALTGKDNDECRVRSRVWSHVSWNTSHVS